MRTDIDLTSIATMGLDLDQYFGLWVIDHARFLSQYERVATMNLMAHVEVHQHQPAAADRGRRSEVITPDGGPKGSAIAIVDVSGTLTKKGSSLSESGSYIALRRTLRTLANDAEIGGAVLRIDSPGGTLSGLDDVVAEIQRFRQSKPMAGFAEDLAASAAYWLLSQTAPVYANSKTALVGSIGNYIGLYDTSAMAGQMGVKPVLIKSGRLKGAGIDGTEITDEQKAYWQELVDKAQVQFNQAIATGRGIPVAAVEQLAEGRAWMAGDAMTRKLIDGIRSLDDVVAELQATISSPNRNARKTMSTEERAAQPATYPELKGAFPKATAEFLTSQLDVAATLDQARAAYQAMLEKRAEEAEAKAAAESKARADAEAKAAADAKTRIAAAGVAVVPEGAAAKVSAIGDAIEEWRTALAAMEAKGMTRPKAISRLTKERPELHEAYVAAYNDLHSEARSAPKKRA